MRFIYKIVEAWRRVGDGKKRQQLFHGTSQTLKKTPMSSIAKQNFKKSNNLLLKLVAT